VISRPCLMSGNFRYGRPHFLGPTSETVSRLAKRIRCVGIPVGAQRTRRCATEAIASTASELRDTSAH
jgi:hypothetical protein